MGCQSPLYVPLFDRLLIHLGHHDGHQARLVRFCPLYQDSSVPFLPRSFSSSVPFLPRSFSILRFYNPFLLLCSTGFQFISAMIMAAKTGIKTYFCLESGALAHYGTLLGVQEALSNTEDGPPGAVIYYFIV